jgi:hypothetical protein
MTRKHPPRHRLNETDKRAPMLDPRASNGRSAEGFAALGGGTGPPTWEQSPGDTRRGDGSPAHEEGIRNLETTPLAHRNRDRGTVGSVGLAASPGRRRREGPARGSRSRRADRPTAETRTERSGPARWATPSRCRAATSGSRLHRTAAQRPVVHHACQWPVQRLRQPRTGRPGLQHRQPEQLAGAVGRPCRLRGGRRRR